MNLLGTSTFPVIMSTDYDHAVMSAARVSAGRAVFFNKENYFTNCDAEPALCFGDTGRGDALKLQGCEWGLSHAQRLHRDHSKSVHHAW